MVTDKGDAFGIETLVLTARGILDCLRGTGDDGVGRLCVVLFNLGVRTTLALNANFSFNLSMGVGKELVSVGVGGCSAELETDIEDVKPGVVFGEISRSVAVP